MSLRPLSKSHIFLVIVFFLSIVFSASGQHMMKKSKRFSDNWFVGASVGGSQLFGDLSTQNPFEKFAEETRIGTGAYLGKQFSPVFGARVNLYYGKLYSEKRSSSSNKVGTAVRMENVAEGSILLTMDFFNFFFKYSRKRVFSIYGILGIGFVSNQASMWTLQNPVKITDNVEQGGAGPKGFSSYFVVPWGAGGRLKISNRFDVVGEVTWHLTADGFDLKVGGSNKDYFSYMSAGMVYKFNTKKRKVVSRIQKEPEPEVVARDTAAPIERVVAPEPIVVPEPEVVEEPVYVPIVPVETKPEPTVPDLEFRVQIRASYGKPVTREELDRFGIPDEIQEEYTDGWYRYTVGSFDNLPDATDYRDLMRTSYGVYDAFVVAYLKGNRLKSLRYLDATHRSGRYDILDEERDNVRYGIQLKASYLRPLDIAAIADEFNIDEPIREDFQDDWYRYSVGDFNMYWKAKEYRNILLTRHNAQGSFVIAFEDDIRTSIVDLIGAESGSRPERPAARPKANVVFYVQILCLDTYKRVPADELNARYDIVDWIRELEEDGLVKYQIGEYTNYEEAKSIRSQMLNKGISDAFIVPYQDGVKISISEAFE